jgi:uncharacterized protein YjbI with pentapeptide repeats
MGIVVVQEVLLAQTPDSIRQRLIAGQQISFLASMPERDRTIDADVIKHAVNSHVRVEIYRAIIRGQLDLNDLAIDQDFILVQCTIVDGAYFLHTEFKRDFSVSDTTFSSGAFFESTTFDHSASFQRTRFEGAPATFEGAHFVGVFSATDAKFTPKTAASPDFVRTRFDANADFASVVFSGVALFNDSQFVGQASFVGTRFERGADFGRVHFSDIATFGVGFPVNFDAKFAGPAFFTEAQFDSVSMFRGVDFGNDANFFSVKFGPTTSFSGATFGGNAVFDRLDVAGEIEFSGHEKEASTGWVDLKPVTFLHDVSFYNSHFDSAAYFDGALFSGSALFTAAQFDSIAEFRKVVFKKDVGFFGGKFGQIASFSGAMFDGSAVFDRLDAAGEIQFGREEQAPPGRSSAIPAAHFTHSVSFSDARFGSITGFEGTLFDDRLGFVAAHFDNDAHFENAEFQGPVSLRSTAFRSVYFSTDEPFKNSIDLMGCTYDRFQGNWRSLLLYSDGKPRVQPYDRQPYVELEGVLRRSGADEEANDVYVERRRAERGTLGFWGAFKDRAYWLLADYGVSLDHELVISLIFLVFGVFIFSHPNALALMNQGNASPLVLERPWRICIFVALQEFLPLSLPFESEWRPTRDVLRFKRMRVFFSAATYANFLQILGWILIPLAVASLTGLLRHAGQ